MSWTFQMGRIKRIHFVGVGGVGMGGIAEVLLSLGYQVSGSDLSDNALTKRLKTLGAEIYQNHDASNVQNVDVVVRSSAIDEKNPEIIAARSLHLPIVARAEMLGELMRFRYGIAIAGTHGKTTTTSLITSILSEEGTDPTFVIGGRLNSAGSNAKLGTGRYLVAEADESDASFLFLKPMISVVTNIDEDHMATYHNNFDELCNAFVAFLQRLPFYGVAVLCGEDAVVRELLPKISRPFVTYGFKDPVDFKAVEVSYEGTATHFIAKRPNGLPDLSIKLNLPGTHNILNALAAIAVATELNISDNAIQNALEKFAGIGRRFQMYPELPLKKGGHVTLIDDYGHHPRELEVTIDAVRKSWPDRRLVMVFQPHRYTRTRDLFADFCNILSTPDALVLLEVYPAGEQYIEGADGASLLKGIQDKNKITPIFVKDHSELANTLQEFLQDQDILLMQGAGNIGALASNLALTELRESVISSCAKETT